MTGPAVSVLCIIETYVVCMSYRIWVQNSILVYYVLCMYVRHTLNTASLQSMPGAVFKLEIVAHEESDIRTNLSHNLPRETYYSPKASGVLVSYA